MKSKKALTLLLALALCLGLAIPAFAAPLDFTIRYGVLAKYNGPGGDVVIPENVTSIGKEVFSNYNKLTSITIPSSVTEIESRAFYKCTGLTSVTIPDSVTTIGSGAFSFCTDLTSVTISNSVTAIEGGAFQGCTRLTSVTIPNGVTKIGKEAFMGCSSLKSVTIPASVTTIEDGAFQNCTSLTDIDIPQGVTAIKPGTFLGCSSLANVTIPSSVTTIDSQAFYNCSSLVSLDLPNGVTSIEGSAFASCGKLTGITIPASVTNILSGAFTSSNNVTIYGEKDSYAQEFAKKKSIPFVEGKAPTATKKAAVTRLAYAATQSVLVNGAPVEFQCYALKDENGNDTNYVKLRDVAYVLNDTSARFEVGWNGAVNIEPGKGYTANGSEMSTPFTGNWPYEPATAPTNVNGTPVPMDAIVLKNDQGGAYTYYKLRKLGDVIGFTVDWSAETGIYITTP